MSAGALFVLYDLVGRAFGPTSERADLLRTYDWRGHDPSVCAVLPLLPGGIMRVSRARANEERIARGLEIGS